MGSILSKLTGEGVSARALRGTLWSFADFGVSQGLRLASNLILTRLLFPEAFGLMALVSVVTVGLNLFSDTGVRPLIVQHARGDDPDFLNTAWTVQVVRGAFLWILLLAIAGPVAGLYDEPQLAQILPVAGLTLLIDGFQPTSVHTVSRHIALARFTQIKLGTQAIGLVIMTILAWELQSVWALVVGNVISCALTTLAYHVFLPGMRNRFRWERDAATQILQFGKWIFLSTAAGFLVNQGDRAILGLYVSLETLGIYNIGYFLASVPLLLFFALQGAVMTPLYRMKPPGQSAANRAALFRARRLITVAMLSAAAVLGFIGPLLVGILYDPRYAAAGAMITLFSVSVVPMISLNTIGAALMGVGDSRAMFFVVGTTAFLQTGLLLVGVKLFGVPGALLSPGIAILAAYPIHLAYSLKYRVFDPVQDFGLTLLGLVLPLVACAVHIADVRALFMEV
jgi:O-antigen/teichoic acid export membrane protein